MKLRLYVSYAEHPPQARGDWIDKGICDPVPPGDGPKWGWGLSVAGGEFLLDLRGQRLWNYMMLVPE